MLPGGDETVTRRPPAPTRREFLATGLTAATAATAGCGGVVPDADAPPTAADWPTRGGDPAGSYHTTAGDAPTSEPELLWRTGVDDLVAGQEPLVYDGRLYPGRETTATLATADGAVSRDGVAFRSAPAVTVSDSYRNATLVGLRNTAVTETLFETERFGAFVGMNAAPVAGDRTRWRWRRPSPPGAVTPWDLDSPVAPVAAGDRVLLGGQFAVATTGGRRRFGGVLAVDTGSGRVSWRHAESTDDGEPIPFGRPSLHDGRVHVGSIRGDVYTMAADGRLTWRHGLVDDVDAPVTVVGAPAATVAVTRESVVGLDPEARSRIWRTPLAGAFETTTRRAITVGDGRVILPVEGGDGGDTALTAFDAATGERQWRVTVPQVSGTPVLADGLVYYSVGDGIAARAVADGSRQFRVGVDDAAALGTPVVAGDTVYTVGTEAVYALGGA